MIRQLVHLLLVGAVAWCPGSAPATAAHGPRLTRIADTRLDPAALYFVSFDGLVNNQAFQQDAIVTYAGYQYAGWYTADRSAMLARRRLPRGPWQTLRLPHRLSADDSHNVISLGISPRDGRLHVAMDTHGNRVYYVRSEAGLVSRPGSRSWTAGRFGPVRRDLDGLDPGPITYAQFVITPDRRLQLSYRADVDDSGAMELAEYDGTWRRLGRWQVATGRYDANGRTSNRRTLYLHGIGYGPAGRLHAAYTWREQDRAVLCHPGGLSNHDIGYVYSDDRGRTWRNRAAVPVAVTGSAPQLSIDTDGVTVHRVDLDRALMNQESQAVDSAGNPHLLISYVPKALDACVDSYAADRTAHARLFHLYRDSSGGWHEDLVPVPLGATGRSQIVLDAHDNIYVVMPFGRVVTASRERNWRDWWLRFDGAGLDAFGEVVVDRRRVETDRVLSILYQQRSTGSTPSALRVVDFRLD